LQRESGAVARGDSEGDPAGARSGHGPAPQRGRDHGGDGGEERRDRQELMSGYRFCRTDDIPLLVDAYNACAGADSLAPALSVADFKRAVREIGLWASSSMLAFEGETPIAVLLGAKTEEANFVHRIVVREDRRRRGH